MNQEITFEMLNALALINKVHEQLVLIASNNPTDGRYRGFVTQIFTLKQDLEDKLREELVDEAPVIASSPNIPTPQTQAQQNASSSNVNGNSASTANPVPNTPQQNSGNNTSQASTPISGDINDFFDSIMAGNTGNNLDLNAILQAAGGNNNNNSNKAPF